jgi:hypothetical protein
VQHAHMHAGFHSLHVYTANSTNLSLLQPGVCPARTVGTALPLMSSTDMQCAAARLLLLPLLLLFMYPAAPDVMRFLMLTYTLAAAPGWVARQTLLHLRGVPPRARQTVSDTCTNC